MEYEATIKKASAIKHQTETQDVQSRPPEKKPKIENTQDVQSQPPEKKSKIENTQDVQSQPPEKKPKIENMAPVNVRVEDSGKNATLPAEAPAASSDQIEEPKTKPKPDQQPVNEKKPPVEVLVPVEQPDKKPALPAGVPADVPDTKPKLQPQLLANNEPQRPVKVERPGGTPAASDQMEESKPDQQPVDEKPTPVPDAKSALPTVPGAPKQEPQLKKETSIPIKVEKAESSARQRDKQRAKRLEIAMEASPVAFSCFPFSSLNFDFFYAFFFRCVC